VPLEFLRIDLSAVTWVCVGTVASLLTLRTLDAVAQHRARLRTRQAIERALGGEAGR
jgi:hypothetical protein